MLRGALAPERGSIQVSLVTALLVFCAGCAARPGVPATPTVVVTRLQLDFPEREKGELEFSLRLPSGPQQVSEVAWELFLDGARFAAGIDGEVRHEDGLFHVKSALTSRHLSWKEGEGFLDVVLQGDVDLGDGRERLRFRDRRELLVHGRPQLHVPRE
jgi:hypothetical protein